MTPPGVVPALARQVAARFAPLPQVVAVALGGSTTGPTVDALSDIDLYIFTRGEIDLAVRQAIVAQTGGASRADMDLAYWGAGDEWFTAAGGIKDGGIKDGGIEVDVMYFDADWLVDQLQRVLVEHQPSLGYSTCFCYTVRHAHSLHDPTGWFAAQQALTRQPYPEALRRRIILHNYPVLRAIIPAYATQLEKATRRHDLVSVNHRLAALLASYFDILFAANRVLHPGEKQLVARMQWLCDRLPVAAAADIEAVIRASVILDCTFLPLLHQLLDRLDEFLQAEGFDLRAAGVIR